MARQTDKSSERDPEAVALGARLKRVRELNGLSQRELARRAGVTNSNISMVEQGQVSPSVGSLARLLEAVPLTLAQFFALDTETATGGVVRKGMAARTECPELGLVIETLPLPGAQPHLLERCELAPGGDTGEAPRTLDAPRAGWLIQGSLELTLGLRCYTLAEGDAFHLPKGQKLRARNPGRKSAVLMITSAGG